MAVTALYKLKTWIKFYVSSVNTKQTECLQILLKVIIFTSVYIVFKGRFVTHFMVVKLMFYS